MLKVLFGVDLPQNESVIGWRALEAPVPNLHFNQSRPIFDSGNLKVSWIPCRGPFIRVGPHFSYYRGHTCTLGFYD